MEPRLTFRAIVFAAAQAAGKVYRVGYLASSSLSAVQPQLSAFKLQLRELGYVEGRSVVFGLTS